VVATDRRRLVIQPGMTGAMFIRRRLTGSDRRYGVLRVRLDDGRILIYHDVRRLGTILWLDPREWARYTRSLGPEPLAPGFSPRALGRALGGSQSAVKKVLMDQRRLAGVGNIYANEALFAAGIDPSRPASRLTSDDHARLHRELNRILRSAISANGSTVRSYRTGRGESGRFQLELLVYDRAGEPCRRCGTTLTATHLIDGRVTVFCHRCQR
jgi:formamidopyrimidine-DNA glycosylase